MEKRIWLAAFMLLSLLLVGGCSDVSSAHITTEAAGERYLTSSEEFISIDSVKYFKEDCYGNSFTNLYRVFSSEEQTTVAVYNPYNSEPYEISVKRFSDTRFLSWETFLSKLLGEPLVFASEEISTLRYLEDITLCSKITIKTIGSNRLADGEYELSPKLKEAVYACVAEKYLQKNIGLNRADVNAETYTVYIYPKGVNAAVEAALITFDINGKAGILTDENTVIPFPENLEAYTDKVS